MQRSLSYNFVNRKTKGPLLKSKGPFLFKEFSYAFNVFFYVYVHVYVLLYDDVIPDTAVLPIRRL